MCEELRKKAFDMDELNESLIANRTWASKLLLETQELTKKSVLNWCNVVLKIGENDVDVDHYISIFLSQVGHLYQDLIADIAIVHEKSLDKIVRLLEDIEQYCKDLRIEMPNFASFENVPLCELYKLVRTKGQEYEMIVKARRKEVHELREKQINLCRSLGRQGRIFTEVPLPLPHEIDEFRAFVDILESEVLDREEKYFQEKEMIIKIIDELGGVTPVLDFESDILNLTNRDVRVSDGDLKQLNEYHQRLQKQLSDTREEILELRTKIDDLWDKLETDIVERDLFRQKYTGNSLKTLEALKTEVHRLETIKKANIKRFIMKQREELNDLWKKCQCTDIEKIKFNFLNSDCYTEDLFELHARELQKWKIYYEENNEILSLLEEFQKVWREHVNLEGNLNGGTNRYKNRGGALLQEERKRNKLRKKIPLMEHKLIELSDNYSGTNGTDFLTFGLTIKECIKKLHEEKDSNFKLKLSAKKLQRENSGVTASIGKSRAPLFPSSNILNPTFTPGKSNMKRKILTPATEPPNKLFKSVTNRSGSKTSIKKTLPQVRVHKLKRRSQKHEKIRQRLSFTKTLKKLEQSSTDEKKNIRKTDGLSTSYEEFEQIVTSKDSCRSTGFVLKNNS